MAHARRRHDDDVIADDPRRDGDVTDDVTGDDDAADYLRRSSSSRPNYDAEMRLRERVSIHSLLLLWLVAWHSGRTSVSGRRTFPVLRSTCS